jgi:hypothetical protein
MFIMALGFLSLAEMEFLSLGQKQRAELGTTATNAIEFASETDLAEIKRRYLLNATAYLTAQAGGSPNLSYCNGSSTSICGACPCDPLDVIMPLSTPPESNLGATQSTCASIDIHRLDPVILVSGETDPKCKSNVGTDMFLAKTAVASQAVDATTGITTVTVLTTYAAETQNEVNKNKSGLSVATSNSLASQSFQITAHISDYSQFIAGWSAVRVPDIP